MKTIKKITALVLVLVLSTLSVFALSSCNKNDGKYTIGICQLVQHAALDAATQGFVDAVKEALGEENVIFEVKNASGDPTVCTTIANDFVTKNVDLIMANATPALQAVAASTKKIPILGTSVTEYGSALGIENFNGTVGGNISGTSDLAPLDEQAQMILDLFPETQEVGLIYSTSESNSTYQVKKVEEYLQNKGIVVHRFGFTDSNDIAAVVEAACAACDVLYIPTDNKAADSAETIGNIVKQKGKPVIAGEAGICSACGVATLSISYYDLGRKTGEMAVQILKGEKNISETAIGYTGATKQYNPVICDLLGIAAPAGYEALPMD